MLFKNHIIGEYDDRNLPKVKAGADFKIGFNTNDFISGNPSDYSFKVRLTGDVDVQQNWMWEGGYPRLYRLIDDALSTETKQSQFSLKVPMNHEDWPRRAYCQIPCPVRLTPQFAATRPFGKWDFSILAKAENLVIDEGGRVSFIIEKYLKKPGVNVKDIKNGPDEVIAIDFPEGTYDFTEFNTSIELDENTASLLVYVTCEHAGGTVWFEDPRLMNEIGENVMPQFTISNPFHEYLNWIGENLARKDWTDVEASVNGETFFVGELFQRCHRYSENEITMPACAVKEGENELSIKNINDFFGALPYKIKKVEILYSENHAVNVISCPSIVYSGKNFGVLVSTKEDNATVEISTSCPCISAEKDSYTFEHKGLNVIPFKAADKAGANITVTFKCGDCVETAKIERIVIKCDDNVLTGTGDAIYVPQDVTQTEEFLAWYLHNEIGNFITFRPTYRWCGTRIVNPAVWARIRELCTQYGIHYCHMIDGRELPGANANPTKAMLESEWFVGNQGHERDGAFYYWGPRRAEDENELLFMSLQAKDVNHPDWIYYNPSVYAENGRAFGHYNPIDTKDMKEAAEHYIENSKRYLGGIKRHTGPSVLFKYFFEAGLEVGGAELMYGPHEVVLSALRGASLAYNRKEFASHLAVQWSTTPHDTLERFRRYQLALFVCYIQGTNHINTEEGLWRIEEDFSHYDRFGYVCQSHRKVQEDFNHFVKTHSRRGKMVNPTALLHGQYDAWVCFTRQNAWAHLGDEWKFDTPEESWDLVKVFYPDSKLDSIYLHPCENKPQGFYSRTPYGTVDILPVEADKKLIETYKTAAFLGWNTAETAQFDKLTDFVKDGGTLLLGWPHLFKDTDRTDAIYGAPTVIDSSVVSKLLGIELKNFVTVKADDGEEIEVGNISIDDCENVTVRSAIGETPLVIEHKIGDGKVLFVNMRAYPAEKHVRPIYESLLGELGEISVESQKQRGWITTTDTADTGVFDREDGLRDIYAININWWTPENVPAKAALHFAGCDRDIAIDREVINIFTLSDSFGVWTADNDMDVISINETSDAVEVTLQGLGKTNVKFISADAVKSDELALTDCGDGIYNAEIELCGAKTIRFAK